jgi:hypothetical protein
MKIYIVIFWVRTLGSLTVGYQPGSCRQLVNLKCWELHDTPTHKMGYAVCKLMLEDRLICILIADALLMEGSL